jgi:hypothetical protein
MRNHNNRRRKRDYFSNVHNLANAMVKGDVEGTKMYFEKVLGYRNVGMDRRDCEEFLREFREEMEQRTQSKQQRAVNKEKAKRRREMRELEKQLGIEGNRKR